MNNAAHNKLTWTKDVFGVRMTDACARRNAEQQKRALCDLLGCPYETCYTSGELIRDAVANGLMSKI